MNLEALWQRYGPAITIADNVARKRRCAVCGRALGGFVPRLEQRWLGPVTGIEYQEGEQPEWCDVDICECGQGE